MPSLSAAATEPTPVGSVARARLVAVNVRELIDLLNQAAADLPDGLESTVLNRGEEAGVLTKQVRVATGQRDEGPAANCLIVEGHPHAGDENMERRPVAMGVDAELARLTSGDPLPRAAISVAIGDTGEGFRIPYGEGGKPILPGSPEAVAAGCICDPEDHDHGRGARSPDGDQVDMVTNDQCQIHRRVEVDPGGHPAQGGEAGASVPVCLTRGARADLQSRPVK